MENSLALTLKYRPKTFDDVVGQERVVTTLKHAIETNHIANAYLLVGPRGIGKTTLSRIFAKALNCSNRAGAEPCGECTNCRQIDAGNSIDVIELDAASHNGVDAVRPIIEQVEFKPATSRYTIFIIDECHMLSKNAWNALLKTLEEPPEHVRFIFATTEGDKVLATVVSRCQRFDLRPIQTEEIVARLAYVCEREQINADHDALLAIARGSDGGMRDALSALDQLISFRGKSISETDALGVFSLISRNELEVLADCILQGDDQAIINSIDRFDSQGRNLRRIATELMVLFRDRVAELTRGSRPAGETHVGRLYAICDQLLDLNQRLKTALSVRTQIEIALLRAAKIATTPTLNELTERMNTK